MKLIELVNDSGLRGRGGASFPTVVKLRSAIEHRARLIVNACDGEIGAHKDAWVVARHLDELREGARLVEEATGHKALWAAHRGSQTARILGLAGLDVLATPERYVSSEESALASLARGGLAKPMTKRAPLSVGFRGLRGTVAPALVLNAETLWRIAQISRRGVDWYRGFGTPDEPGPRLASVTRTDGSAFVLETEAGAPVPQLLARVGEVGEPRHLLIGGLGGVFLVNDPALRWSDASLAPLGAHMGPGVLIALDPRRCPLETVEQYLAYAAGESAGQCGPCMFGIPETLERWRRFVALPTRESLDALEEHVGLLSGRGACRFPDGIAGFVSSATALFADHATRHTATGCPVLVGAR